MTKQEIKENIELLNEMLSSPDIDEQEKNAYNKKLEKLTLQLAELEKKPIKKEKPKKTPAEKKAKNQEKKEQKDKEHQEAVANKKTAKKKDKDKVETKSEEIKEEKTEIKKKLAKAKVIVKDLTEPTNIKLIKAGEYKDKTLDQLVDIAGAEDLEITIRKKPKDKSEETRRKNEAIDVVNRFIPDSISKEKKEYIKEKGYEEQLENQLSEFMADIRAEFASADTSLKDIDVIYKVLIEKFAFKMPKGK